MNRETITLRSVLDRSSFLDRGGLGGDEELLAEAGELFERASGVARPKALMIPSPVEVLDGARVLIAGTQFKSSCLAGNLSGLGSVIVYLATCGGELDLLAAGGDGLRTYWLDLIKELALESVVEEVNRRAAALFGSETVASMNPGSADADIWPIEQQERLFSVFGDTETKVGVRLTSSMLMIPNKSISGVLFPSRNGWMSCRVCTRRGCIGRRAPYESTISRNQP